MLEVAKLTKRYGGLVANDDGSFTVGAVQILGLIVPNGAGLSTPSAATRASTTCCGRCR